jgi:hypothetical protein
MKVLMNKISYTAMAASAASDLIEAKKHDDKAGALRENVNKVIVVMHKDKVVIGRYSKDGTGCSSATAFVDTLTKGGWAKKTAQNYLSLFREAVKTGKPVKDWGGTKAGGRKAAGSKPNSAKGKKEFADKLATAFRDAEFEGFINDLESSFQDDEIQTLIEGVKSFLEASGIEIK